MGVVTDGEPFEETAVGGPVALRVAWTTCKISWDSTQIKLYSRLASHPARLICCNLLSEISR